MAKKANWEAAFSLSDSTRQRVLSSSRFRRRPPSSSIAHQATATLFPSQPNMSNATNTRSPSSGKTTQKQKPDNDAPNTDDAVPPSSLRKQPIRRIYHTSNQTTHRPSSHDNFQCDVPCPAKPFLPKKKLLKRIPPPAASSPEDGENVDRNDCMTISISTNANISSSHKSKRKKAELFVETNIETILSFDDQTATRLEAEFFQCDALELAPKLLGKFLRRDEVVLQITEVEAYRPNDSACHGRFGVTPRTAPVFGPGGHAYVYVCYGLHTMLNVVADVKGVGAAVLIRSCAPVAGMQTIQSRRGISSNKPILLTGPGKVGQALGLTKDWSNHPLYTAGGLELLDGPPLAKILVGPRVGIDYANPEDVAALWRFAISGTPWISAPRNTLAPPPSSS